MPGRHRQGRHRRPHRNLARIAVAGLLVVTAPTVVLTASAPDPAPAPTAGARSTPTAPPIPPAPATTAAPVEVVVSCDTIADVDTAQRALDDDALAPVLDTDGDGVACETRWPRTPPETGVLDDVGEVVGDVVDTLTGQCGDTGFDGVEPNVAVVGHHLQARFALGQILGVGSRAGNPTSDHPRGLALDLFATRLVGDQLAAYVLDRRVEFGVTYVIWRQRINYGNGWEPMADRGGITANHYDHAHVSFDAGADVAELTC